MANKTGTVKSITLKAASPQPVRLEHSASPPRFVKPKRLHPRRVLPFVKEGMERDLHDYTTSRAFIRRPEAMATPARVTLGELSVVLNTELTEPARQLTSSNVGEPSVAIKDQVVFYTGNWYAAFSQDGGRTFRFVDPKSTSQPGDPPASQFCCDQVVNYISSLDTFVWLLQYGPEQDNIQRIGFAKTADVAAANWHFFDLTTAALDVPGAFLDFPDLAVSAKHLYITTNIFLPNNDAGSAVVRIPLAGIGDGQITAQPFKSMDLQSFRVAQNCGDTGFFAAHQDTSTLALFSWPDGENGPDQKAIGVARWIGNNGYQSRTPDGRRWLDRADPRITGATLAGNDLWFAWSVDSGSNHRDKPFAQIARINSQDLTLLENINIFDTESAIAYPALSSNAVNEVGVSYMIGGGPQFPSHVVGILTNDRQDQMVTQGARGPLLDQRTGKGEWGDYLTVRSVFPDRKLFAAAGYVLKGTRDDQNLDATPHFVVFGRSSAAGPVPVAPATAGGGITPSIVGGTSTGSGSDEGPAGPIRVSHGPIADVNTLGLVKPDVAAAIKAACMAAGAEVRALAAPMGPRLVTKPGVERWPVKTGTDDDVALVGKNLIAGKNLGAGIVEATVEELIVFPRIPDMPDVTKLNPAFQSKRALPVELVIWTLKVTITAIKLEADGDYHLVLQGASGETMIGEVPTPTKTFLGDSPWLQNIKVARQAVDDKLLNNISPRDFALSSSGMLVPRESLASLQFAEMANFRLPESFKTPPEGQEMTMMTFKTKVQPTPATVTGVGFFDKVHGQMGVSQANGIEIHPILKIVFP